MQLDDRGRSHPLRVDAHTHVFSRSSPMSSGRRYTPGYDATPTALFGHLAAHGMTHAVLVQPSFLGTDNSELLNAIAAHPERLRGVAVIDFDVSDRELCALREGGVVGVRFNLVGA